MLTCVCSSRMFSIGYLLKYNDIYIEEKITDGFYNEKFKELKDISEKITVYGCRDCGILKINTEDM